MSEIDPVILDLRAEMGKYRADLRNQAADTEKQLGRMDRSVQRLEKQMLKSSTAISGALRNIGGALGTYFSGRELVGLIDNFTRLQNALKVTGLEGEQLDHVQTRLLDLSSRYGVSVNELADLYGKAAQAGTDLGASQEDLLKVAEASAQALKITGTNAAQAQGALLGLTQALASGRVKAEEFNQINEGGLRPLLQVVAAQEKYGGSVAKLRQAVVDGKVSSEEFYRAILNGSQQLEGQASKATLTLEGAFEALTSRLTVYIGQAAQTSGATEALAAAMGMLADNLDTIVPLLSVIGVSLFGRFAAGALLGGRALQTLGAYASIATTSLAGTALAARSAGAALLAAFGGPVGVAITAVILGLGYLVTKANQADAAMAALRAESEETADRLDEMATKLEKAGVKTDEIRRAAAAARGDVSALADEFNRASVEAHKMADAYGAAALKIANLRIQESQARQQGLQGLLRAQQLGNPGGENAYVGAQADTRKRIAEEKAFEAGQRGIINAVSTAFQNGVKLDDARSSSSSGGDDKKKKKRSGGRSGPTAAEIEDRFQSELASITQQTLSARQSLATSAEDRAELELRAVEAARTEALRSLEADKTYTAAQKARVRDALENLAEFERERVARDKRVAMFEEANQIADAEFQAQSDSLRQQYDLAKSQAERRNLAYEIIDLEYRYRDAMLQATIDNEDLAANVRERARIEQAALRGARDRTKEAARRDTAGPLEAYFDKAKKDASELNEAYESIAVDGLQSLNDGLVDAIVNSKSLGDVFKNVAKQIIADLIRIAIQQTIVNSLMSALSFGGGGGGGIGSIGSGASGFGSALSIFGRASGGYVAPGQTVRVNEHAGGAEYLRMGSRGGTVIPLGQVNERAFQPSSQSNGVVTLRIVEAPGFAARVRAEAEGVAINVQREAAPEIINYAADEALRRASRPTL